MENEQIPELIRELSIEEAMSLEFEEGISTRVVIVLSKFSEDNKEEVLLVDDIDSGKKKFIGGNLKKRHKNVIDCAQKVLLKKLGYFFNLKNGIIFFAGKFSSTVKGEPEHRKVFIYVEDFLPGWSSPETRRAIYWRKLCSIDEIEVVTSQHVGLRRYKSLPKSKVLIS